MGLWEDYWQARSDLVFDYKAETAVLLQELRSNGAQTVLSLGCGTGPYLRRLVREGIQGSGVDWNENLLKQARDSAPKMGASLHFVNSDIRSLPDLGTFDAVIAMHLTFSQDDWSRILHGARSSLRPGGLFIAGFVFRVESAENTVPVGTQDVEADLLRFSSDITLIEVDVYRVRDYYYECSMYLLAPHDTGCVVDRNDTRIYFFPSKDAIMEFLGSKGFGAFNELGEDHIGFEGIRAVLASSKLTRKGEEVR